MKKQKFYVILLEIIKAYKVANSFRRLQKTLKSGEPNKAF